MADRVGGSRVSVDVSVAGGELAGRYANFFSVGHNALEFVVDFGEFYSGTRERMHSRIVMNPSCAKELLRVLGLSVHSFEENFRAIPDISAETKETQGKDA